MVNRKQIATKIVDKITAQKSILHNQYLASKDEIGFFYIDDLLPNKLVAEIFENFPKLFETKKKNDFREQKYVAYQMNKYHPLLEEVIYAFQEQEVVNIIAEIVGLDTILPDSNLYAGGLSLMAKNNFLSPHLDNSHDKDVELWRVFNLLYYLTPNWKLENGGNLEFWPNGLKSEPITIESKYNRLVVMATHQKSWHSVNKVTVDDIRCCVSNYYFSKQPLLTTDYFHITTFRARPTQKVKDIFFVIDNTVRSTLRKFFKKGIRENPHRYKKK